jgi:hypothetical protein
VGVHLNAHLTTLATAGMIGWRKMKQVINSLEDIATHFNGRAKRALELGKSFESVALRKEYESEAEAWLIAADMLWSFIDRPKGERALEAKYGRY